MKAAGSRRRFAVCSEAAALSTIEGTHDMKSLATVAASALALTISTAIPGYSAGAMLARRVPFWPLRAYALSPSGEMIHGDASEYRFVIERRGDNAVTKITNSYEPVTVDAREADWHRARVTAYMSQGDAGWQWDAPEIPAVKPPYSEFVPASSGDVWVIRPGPGYEDTQCDPETAMDEAPEICWKDSRIVDVFGADGRLLGQVDVPRQLRLTPRPFIQEETVVGVIQDEAGTIMVKRYRLVLPGE